ncbi:S-4TM family putative pore-forming effector [Lentzea californiensis]|uniref:S-4TM family putative pore-forming effector n=1 Tax=Lentzea californiensis TaxID=438851 RepID=UPI002164DB90|nr:S-4TM family putative pore-forming effector [Lentzea californiensis]MCR3747239.1 hypothetical protein [Lentzea californiensis]
MGSINARQNDDQAISLLKCSRVSNTTPTRIEAVRTLGSIALVVITIVYAILGRTEPILALSGALWALISTLGLAQWSKQKALEAATIQEHFDTYVFELPWNNSRAAKIQPERLHDLAGRYRGSIDDLKNWYPDVSKTSRPFDIMLCQRSNLTWDIRLRERWMNFVRWARIGWVTIGVAVGVAGGMTVWTTLLRWYVPSLAAIILATEIVRAQRNIVGDRKILLGRLQDVLDPDLHDQPSPERVKDIEVICRDIQDGIFDTRNQVARVPNWFYKYFRGRDESAMQAAASSIQQTPDSSGT